MTSSAPRAPHVPGIESMATCTSPKRIGSVERKILELQSNARRFSTSKCTVTSGRRAWRTAITSRGAPIPGTEREPAGRLVLADWLHRRFRAVSADVPRLRLSLTTWRTDLRRSRQLDTAAATIPTAPIQSASLRAFEGVLSSCDSANRPRAVERNRRHSEGVGGLHAGMRFVVRRRRSPNVVGSLQCKAPPLRRRCGRR